jgi:hypothetical protein
MPSDLKWVVFKHGPAHDERHLMWDHERGPIVYMAPSPDGRGYAVVQRSDYPGALPYRDSNLGLSKRGPGAEQLVYVPAFPHRKVRTGGLLRAIRDRIVAFRADRNAVPLGRDGLCMTDAHDYDTYDFEREAVR